MPKRPKQLLEMSLEGKEKLETKDKIIEPENKQEKDFVKVKRELTDFKIGLKVPSKIRPKRINGGVLLVDFDYNLR